MEGEVITGPWRATRLWNDVVRGFHAGMPRRSRKHKSRRGLGAALAPLRPHHGASSSEDAAEECFSGSEAAEWLHKRLIKNPNFGPDVSKEQTAMLLQKMLRAGIFVPVNSGQEESVGADGDWDKGRAEFSPSALYRFVEVGVESLRTPGKKTPSKSSNGERRAAGSNGLSSLDNSYCAPAAPSATSSSTSIVGRKSRVGRSELTAEDKENLNRSYFHSLPANSLLAAMDEEGERVWGEAFTALLGRDLQQSPLLPAPVQVKCVVHNMTRVSPKGVVQLDGGGRGQDGEDLPHWVLSAMKCLANWPRPLRMASGEDSPLPSYPGFAQDVFGVVKDYFLETCRTPLVPFGLYEAFVSVLLKAEGMGRRVPRPQMSQHHHLAPTYGRHHPQPPPPFQSQPPPSVATSTPTLAAAASTATASNYGLDPFLLSGREQQHERVARIRHTLDVKTAGHTASTASLGNSSSFFDHSHSTTVSSGMSECQPGPHSAPSIQQQQQQPRGAVAPPRRLSPSMSTTAIIRTFLPPNTCFETAFMHEDPVTRIVPQKGSDTIHLNRSAAVGPPPEQHARMSSTSSQRNLSLIQQQQQQQQQAVRQPRWRRTSRERQSIAVMEGHLRPQQQQWNSYHYHRQQQQQQQQRPPRHPSPARSECLYSSRRQSFQPQRPSRNLSSSADDLLDSSNRSNATLLSYRPRHTSPHSAVSETYHTNPDASRGCSSSAASDHIILSKAVRKEKRKQQLKKGQQQQQRSRSADGCSLPHQTREWRPPQQQQQQQHQVRYRSDRYRSLVVKTPILVDARTGLPTEGVRCVRAEPYSNSSAEGSREDVLQDQAMTPSLSPEGKEHFVRACRLLGLLLPPPNRRKLQLLLKFVRRVASNPRLRLDGSGRQGNLSLALTVLSPAVLRPYAHLSHDADVGRRAAALFAQMYEEVWTPVEELRKEVEEKVYQSLVSKRLAAGEDPFPVTFCRRVSARTFEAARSASSEGMRGALHDLLAQIVDSDRMSAREKRKRLRKFRETHPDVYRDIFPSEELEPDFMASKDNKDPSSSLKLVGGSLSKIRSVMRI